MTVWCRTRQEFDQLTANLEPYRQQVESVLLKVAAVPGYCRACKKVTLLRTGPEPAPGEWKNLLEGMLCSCGLNGRMRLCLQIVEEELLQQPATDAAVLERITPLFPHLQARIPGLIGCEFISIKEPGGSLHSVHGVNNVQHENFMSLSFASNSLDLLLHFDVLEHVPDARVALQNALRVLKPGGRTIFSCPFYHNLPHNIVRAVVENGELKHLLPQCYHGNPMSSQGSLVYIHPTWDIMELLRDIGFADVRIGLSYNPTEGTISNGCPYEDGHTWPVVIVAQK